MRRFSFLHLPGVAQSSNAFGISPKKISTSTWAQQRLASKSRAFSTKLHGYQDVSGTLGNKRPRPLGLSNHQGFEMRSSHDLFRPRLISTTPTLKKKHWDINHQYPISNTPPESSSSNHHHIDFTSPYLSESFDYSTHAERPHDPNNGPDPNASTNQHPTPKGLLDTTLSCTTINDIGHVVAVSENIPKARFLSKYKLYARDLRSIDRTPVSIIPSILVRDSSILVNLLHIKAMIRYNKVLIFDTHDAKNNTKLSLFMYDLESKLQTFPSYELGGGPTSGPGSSANTQNYKQPFEMKALESILMNVVSTLETEMKAHVSIVNEILASLEDHIDREQLKELLIRNKALSKFLQKSTLIRNVINELLDTDEDLVGMYLTEKHDAEVQKQNKTAEPDSTVASASATQSGSANGPLSSTSQNPHASKIDPNVHPTRSLDDHEDVELLLESYYKQCDEIVQQAGQVISNVKNTEEIINIILDANRNSLMLMELKVTIATLGFTTGAFFASLYGMNLENFIEEAKWGFSGVTGAIVFIATVTTVYNFRMLQRVRRMTMSGTGISRKIVGNNLTQESGYGSHLSPEHAATAAYNSSFAAGQGTGGGFNPAEKISDEYPSQNANGNPFAAMLHSHMAQTHSKGHGSKHPQHPWLHPYEEFKKYQHQHQHSRSTHPIFQNNRRLAMWAYFYRIWKGRAAERKMRRQMWMKENKSPDHSHRRDIVWKWLVDSNNKPPSNGGFNS